MVSLILAEGATHGSGASFFDDPPTALGGQKTARFARRGRLWR